MKNLRSLLLASGICLAFAGPALAETYRFANYNSPQETTSVANKWLFEELAKQTNGALQFELFLGGTIIPARESLKGLGEGIAQAAFYAASYTPSDLPLGAALSGYGFVETDPTTIGAAYADWVMHDPAGLEQFLQNNVVPLGGFSTPTYPAICNTPEPITTLEQMQGLKIRFPGGLISKLAQDIGAIPVSLPAPEIYQALQNGSIDCAGILAPWLNIDNNLDEVSKSVTLLNWTGSYNSPIVSFNRDFWSDGLTAEQRAIIIKLAARAHAKAQILFNDSNTRALATTKALGHPVVEPGDDIKKAVADWVANGVGDMATIARDVNGVADPAALFASFDPYVKKWHDLIGGMKDKNNEDELTQIFLDNMFNDLDPATYGVK